MAYAVMSFHNSEDDYNLLKKLLQECKETNISWKGGGNLVRMGQGFQYVLKGIQYLIEGMFSEQMPKKLK